MVGVAAPKLSEPRPIALFSFSLPIYEQTAGLQRYASDWNSVQTYASKSHRVGHAGPSNPHESARFTANLCFRPCKPLGEVTFWNFGARTKAGFRTDSSTLGDLEETYFLGGHF
jgi:hypothetical protein